MTASEIMIGGYWDRNTNVSTVYSKCPKILYVKVSDKIVYANMQSQNRWLPQEQSDQGLHCHSTKFVENNCIKSQTQIYAKNME